MYQRTRSPMFIRIVPKGRLPIHRVFAVTLAETPVETQAGMVAASPMGILNNIGAAILVEDLPQRDELTIDIAWLQIAAGHAPPSHNDCANEPRVRIPDPVRVRVIEPDDRTRIARSRAGPLRNLPHIDLHIACIHRVVALLSTRRSIVRRGALVGFEVEDTVRVQ